MNLMVKKILIISLVEINSNYRLIYQIIFKIAVYEKIINELEYNPLRTINNQMNYD